MQGGEEEKKEEGERVVGEEGEEKECELVRMRKVRWGEEEEGKGEVACYC